jgi:hypothetical protein
VGILTGHRGAEVKAPLSKGSVAVYRSRARDRGPLADWNKREWPHLGGGPRRPALGFSVRRSLAKEFLMGGLYTSKRGVRTFHTQE